MSVLNKHYIALTFSSGLEENYTVTRGLLKVRKLRATFYIIPTRVGTTGYMTWEQIKTLSDEGFDIQCHSYDHDDLTTLSESEIRADFEAVDTAFFNNNIPAPKHHAYPYGEYNATVTGICAEYRDTGRAAWQVRTPNPYTSTPSIYDYNAVYAGNEGGVYNFDLQSVKNQIDEIVRRKDAWQMFSHAVSTTPGEWDIHTDDFIDVLDYLEDKEFTIVTMSEMYDELFKAFDEEWDIKVRQLLDIEDCVLHLKADGIIDHANDDSLQTWHDYSGNVYDCTQATSAKQPTYKTNIINGKPVVRFDGTDDFLVGSGASFSTGGKWTAFVVLQSDNIPNETSIENPVEWASHFFINWDHTSAGAGMRFSYEDINSAYSNARFAPVTTNFHIVSGRYNGTLLEALREGGWVRQVTANAPKDSESYSFGIGAAPWDGFHFEGDIAEVLIYNRDLTNKEVRDINEYLGNKYDIELLPNIPQTPSAWYDANSLGLANNTSVTTWAGIMNPEIDATQATAAKKPTYKTNVVKGNAMVDFDGGDVLITPTNALLSYPTDGKFTFFITIKGASAPDGTSNSNIFEYGNNFYINWDKQEVGYQDTSDAWIAVSYATVGADTLYLIMGQYDGTNLKVERDMEQITSSIEASPKDGSWNILGIGGAPWDGHYYTGQIGEIIFYKRDLSSAEIEQVEEYLKFKWLNFYRADGDGQTKRILKVADTAANQTKRVITFKDTLANQTKRIIKLKDTVAYQTRRLLHLKDTLINQTKRVVTLKDTAIYQTKRILTVLGSYLSQTRRILYLKDIFNYQARRLLHLKDIFNYQTKRVIALKDIFNYQTKRAITSIDTAIYQTSRTVKDIALVTYSTVRTIKKKVIFVAQTVRDVIAKILTALVEGVAIRLNWTWRSGGED